VPQYLQIYFPAQASVAFAESRERVVSNFFAKVVRKWSKMERVVYPKKDETKTYDQVLGLRNGCEPFGFEVLVLLHFLTLQYLSHVSEWVFPAQ